MKNILVRTTFYWSCVRGPVLIVRSPLNMHCYYGIESSHKNLFSLVHSALLIIGAPKSKLNFTRAHFLLALLEKYMLAGSRPYIFTNSPPSDIQVLSNNPIQNVSIVPVEIYIYIQFLDI